MNMIWSPLAVAVQNLDLEEVRRLLDAGADPNESVNNGALFLLHIAIDSENDARSYGYEVDASTTRLLVARGADIDQRTSDGLSPIELANRGHHREAVDFLRSRGAKE